MISFKNKKILVTGASSGIGREISIHLSELGAKLVMLARDTAKLEQTLSLLKGEGHSYISFDLKNVSEIKQLIIDLVASDSTKFDGLVYCAGTPSVLPLKVINHNNFKDSTDINFYSYVEIIKHFSRKNISNDDSSVVFISSVLTKIPKKAQTLYISSKSAAQSVSKVLSLELSKRKIRINSVLVGTVLTGMVEDTQVYRELATVKVAEDYNPICKTLSPREVSNMVAFLLSDSARYIIGEEYYMDGGYF